MPVYAFEGLVPVVGPGSYVHPTAVLIGDVIIGQGCYIGPGAALRGDFGRIVMQDGSNLQDNCVMHSFPGTDCVIEIDGHVGHGAILHGCRVGRNALVGMGAVVMDEADIGEDAFVAALAFVRAGFKLPPRQLAGGVPAKILRDLTDQDIAWKSRGTAEYQALARRCLAGALVPAEPLSAAEPDRKRLSDGGVAPLIETKRRENA
jgi:phenylacetic acid degradation protein